jgi:hypothetical protein
LQEFVLKREASVTSAEALDQISFAYPDAEILSFRRIKEAGSESEFYVARLRTSMEMGPVEDPADSMNETDDEVVVEGKEHEENEEALMQQALDLIKEILDEVKSDDPEEAVAEKDLDQKQLEMEELPKSESEESPVFNALPKDVRPPVMGMGTVSKITVARKADVSKAAAKVELLKEFAKDGYKISSFNEGNGHYFVDLIRVSAEDDVDKAEKRSPYGPGARIPKMFTDTSVGGDTYMGDEIKRHQAIVRFLDKEKTYPMGPEGAKQKALDLKKAEQDFLMSGGIPKDAEDYLLWFWEAVQSRISDPVNNPEAISEAIDMVDQEYKTIMSKLPAERRAYRIERAKEIAPALGIKIPKEFVEEEEYSDRNVPFGERGPATSEGLEELGVQQEADEAAVPEEVQEGWQVPESWGEVRDFSNGAERLDFLLEKIQSPEAKKLLEHWREISFGNDEEVQAVVNIEYAPVIRQAQLALEQAQQNYAAAEQSQDEDAMTRAEIALENAGKNLSGYQEEVQQKINLLIQQRPINQKTYAKAVQMASRITDEKKQELYLKSKWGEVVPGLSKRNPAGAIKEAPQRARERMIEPKADQKRNLTGLTPQERHQKMLQRYREQMGTRPMRRSPAEMYMPEEEQQQEVEQQQ